MIELWLMLGLLLLPLAACIGWPLLRRRPRQESAAGAVDGEVTEAAQAALFREHESELKASLASGAITESEFTRLRAEMARKFIAEERGGYRLSGINRGGRGLLFVLAVAVPFVAVGLYSSWGSHKELALYRDIASSHSGATDMVAEARITQRLQERVRTHPEDLSSRYVLAQRLLVSNDIAGAVGQYRHIVTLQPQASHIRAELAQALFFAGGSRMTDEVTEQVRLVLEADPHNATALGLAGIAAFEREEFRAARDYWRQALAQAAPGTNAAQALAAGVARAEQALAQAGEGGKEVESASVVAETPEAADGEASEDSIRVRVSLAPEVTVAPETPVFIYARSAQSPMPLAIARLTAADLPVEVVLDESRAMMPGRSIKTVDEVQLVARVAVNGNARPAAGDWQGDVVTLKRGDWGQPVAITIDTRL